ncbi:MAG: Omp28 family outer membrane lipoprotein [Prevotella sp.]
MIKYIYLAMLMLLLVVSCSEVDEGERYVELPKVEIRRNVLVEEYTGQRCTNCPDAHRQLVGLQQQYGEQLIVVAIHAGGFGIAEGSNPKILGLMQPEGNVYASYWGVTEYPSAVIDRRSGVLKSDAWATAIREALECESELKMEVEAEIVGDEVRCRVWIEPTASFDGKLQLWLTESGITALQIDNGVVDTEYNHNHVFRACIKKEEIQDEWGEPISLKANIHQCIERRIALKENWNKEKLHIVAFVYNESRGVEQVVEEEIINKSETI